MELGQDRNERRIALACRGQQREYDSGCKLDVGV
jgi:hypothetical protein